MIEPGELKYGELVKLDYTPEDLEPQDLGMSGIVLSSPLLQFTDLDAEYEYMGAFEFNAKNHCFVRAKLNDFNHGRQRIYMTSYYWLKKVE